MNGVLLLLLQFNNLHIFHNFGLFLEWLRRRCRCRCWRVDFLLLRFLLMWLHGLIQAMRWVVASGADASGLVGMRHLSSS